VPPTSLRCPACGHELLTIDLPQAQLTGQAPSPRADSPLLLRIPEAARLLGVSRSTMYELMAKGEVQVVRIGRSVRVARADVERMAVRHNRQDARRPAQARATEPRYPSRGDGTSRIGYGPAIFALDNYRCDYCGLDMADEFESWLQLSVDHVVPRSMARRGFDPLLLEDMANLVTCCRACNEFGNRYSLDASVPTTEDEFWDLRDRAFAERRALTVGRREQARARYRSWRKFTWFPEDLQVTSDPAES